MLMRMLFESHRGVYVRVCVSVFFGKRGVFVRKGHFSMRANEQRDDAGRHQSASARARAFRVKSEG